MSRLEKVRIGMWTFLVLFAIGWGIATGASYFAGVGLSPSLALFGCIGIGILAMTMLAMHREHPISAEELQR